MFTRKMMLLALWSVAVGAIPALATLDPVVRPAIDKIPNKPAPAPYVTPNNPAPFNPNPIKADPRNAVKFSDGRQAPAEAVCERIVSPYAQQPIYCQTGYQYGGEVGWWGRGPIRRFISWPFRRWRRC